MHNQIVTLKDKTNGVVPIRIPVPVFIFFCGNPVDNQVSAVVTVQSPDYIQQRGFSGAAGTQDRHELAVPKFQADMIQRLLHQIPGPVFLAYILDLVNCETPEAA